MRGILLRVAYDGSGFHGFARQDDVRTVYHCLREAVTKMDPNITVLRGASRTDAGVHARGQLVAFDTATRIDVKGWVLGVNQHLPEDVCVTEATYAPVGYHPRFDAKRKRYIYTLLQNRVRDPLLRHRTWFVRYKLDVDVMKKEASSLLGTHDFAAFHSARDHRKATVRTIDYIDVEKGPEGTIAIAVEGKAFLYNMVRIIAGTLVDVGSGRMLPGTIAEALVSKDRLLAGMTAPAHGLVLESIEIESKGEMGERWPR